MLMTYRSPFTSLPRYTLNRAYASNVGLRLYVSKHAPMQVLIGRVRNRC